MPMHVAQSLLDEPQSMDGKFTGFTYVNPDHMSMSYQSSLMPAQLATSLTSPTLHADPSDDLPPSDLSLHSIQEIHSNPARLEEQVSQPASQPAGMDAMPGHV